MEQEERKAIVMGVFKDEKVQDRLEYLYARWQDEREYEDINDYGTAISPRLERHGGVTFKKMQKRPFGFVFMVDNRDYEMIISNRTMQVRQKLPQLRQK